MCAKASANGHAVVGCTLACYMTCIIPRYDITPRDITIVSLPQFSHDIKKQIDAAICKQACTAPMVEEVWWGQLGGQLERVCVQGGGVL